jgi:hypothetical protein
MRLRKERAEEDGQDEGGAGYQVAGRELRQIGSRENLSDDISKGRR